MSRPLLANPSVNILSLRLLRRCRRAEGICPYCPKAGPERICIEGRAACKGCLKMFRLASRRLIESRRAEGACPRCGHAPPTPGKWACLSCRISAAKLNARSRERAKAAMIQSLCAKRGE